MATGLLSNILNFIDQSKQSVAARAGLLVSNPQEYLAGINEGARGFNRGQEAGLLADRNMMRGLPVTLEQMRAKQFADRQLEDLALGFVGNIKPVNLNIKQIAKTGLSSPSSLTMPSVPTVEQMQKYGRSEVVPLSKAVSFQSQRNFDKFFAGKHPGDLVEGFGDKPLALRLETGEYVIYDGNHRTDLALQKGKTELPMHVIDVKSYDPAHAGRKPVPYKMTDDELLKLLLGS